MSQKPVRAEGLSGGIGPAMNQALQFVVACEEEYERKKASAASSNYVEPPTTKKVATHLGLSQRKALEVLNYLELLGLVVKHRRYSPGPSGYGYDGSRYSEVRATEKGRQRVTRLQSTSSVQ